MNDTTGRRVVVRAKMRPAGSLCEQCSYRVARPDPRWSKYATRFCSDICRVRFYGHQTVDQKVDLTNRLRRMLGLPDDRGATLSVPELEAIIRRLHRVLPYGGIAMRMPPRTHRRRAS